MSGAGDSRCPSGGGIEHRKRPGESLQRVEILRHLFVVGLKKVRLWPVMAHANIRPQAELRTRMAAPGEVQRVQRLRNCTTKLR
jgi:hypothetical protein